MKRETILKAYVKTMEWFEEGIVDWNSAGTFYSLDGNTKKLQKYHFGFTCDSSITSPNGEYVLIYQKLGTKGLLLKNGELLREINRSYYQSAVYEFPAAFFMMNGRTYLAHCPAEYCRIDFEDAETGEIITNVTREPQDIFHSRLEISPDNKYLLVKGWVWHPWDVVGVFDIEKCISNPQLLDEGMIIPNSSTEICSASFIDNERILLCASKGEPFEDKENNPITNGYLAIWDFKKEEIIRVIKVEEEIGNIFAINDEFCWDLYGYPKIIDLNTGKIIDKNKDVFSGNQNSSIIHHLDKLPQISFNRKTKQVAIAYDNMIEVLTQ